MPGYSCHKVRKRMLEGETKKVEFDEKKETSSMTHGQILIDNLPAIGGPQVSGREQKHRSNPIA